MELKAPSHFSETLDYEGMKEVVERGGALILDARPELFHRLGHIPGALSLPRDDFEQGYMALKDCIIALLRNGIIDAGAKPDVPSENAMDNLAFGLAKNYPLVLYCANDTCKDAELAREALAKLGYTRISIYTGGWAEWHRRSVTND